MSATVEKGFTANNLIEPECDQRGPAAFVRSRHQQRADQALLTGAPGFGHWPPPAGFNKLPYAGYSAANTVAQSLRPFPQFGNINSLGVPLGESRYDSLQVKATKRYSHGLNLTATFTWQNERTNMVTDAHRAGEQRLRSSRKT